MTHRRWDRSKSPERYLLSQGLPSGALPPAIRPGLHCGVDWNRLWRRRYPTSPGHQAGAPLRQTCRPRGSCHHGASPGHQAGAPLRRCREALHRRRDRASPGHQAGAPLRRVYRGALWWGAAASPGHQAGAPLRRPSNPVGASPGMGPSPGHQAGAPLRRHREAPTAELRHPFPRPSGRGSIAADVAAICTHGSA